MIQNHSQIYLRFILSAMSESVASTIGHTFYIILLGPIAES
jgi:hypothetical protein